MQWPSNMARIEVGPAQRQEHQKPTKRATPIAPQCIRKERFSTREGMMGDVSQDKLLRLLGEIEPVWRGA